MTLAPATEPAVGQSNEATRIAWTEKALAALPTGLRLLDAGAGEQQFRRCCTHLQYVSQDFAQYQPEKTAAGLHPTWDYCKEAKLDIVCDIIDIPEPDRSFDAILCTEVFEHIPNPVLALEEFARLLKPNGQVIITAPFCSLTHFAPHHHATGLSRFWYEHHLPALGFEILELTPNGNYFEYLAQEIRRISQVSRRYADLAPTTEQKLAMRQVLGFLEQASTVGDSSSELLCFGWHVRAKKL